MSNTGEHRPARCPSREALEAFNSGELPEARLVVIANHVADCGRCEMFLGSLDVGDASVVLAAVTEMERWEGLFEDPAFQRLASFARSIPVPDDVSAIDVNDAAAAAGGATVLRWAEPPRGSEVHPALQSVR